MDIERSPFSLVITLLIVASFPADELRAGPPAETQSVSTASLNQKQGAASEPTKSSAESEERKLFTPKSIGDGKLTTDVWFHQGVWTGPNDKTVTVMTATFPSVDAATKWANKRTQEPAEVIERKPILDPQTGARLGERLLIIFRSTKEDESFNVLLWTDGATVREIRSVSQENVLLAEKVFFPKYYQLSSKH